MVNKCTKYEVSIINLSEDIRIPKFENGSRDPSHAPFGVNFSSAGKRLHAICIRTQIYFKRVYTYRIQCVHQKMVIPFKRMLTRYVFKAANF